MDKFKQFLLLFVILTLSCVSFSQNYCTINPNSLNYYLSNTGEYRPLKIKTIQVIGSDTFLYPIKESFYHIIPESEIGCVYIDTSCFIGSKVRIGSNGINEFYDNAGNGIIIKTLAKPAEKWIMYRYTDSSMIVGSVDYEFFDNNYQNIADSVKIISIAHLDKYGDTISDIANGKKIYLSKHNGLLIFWNFLTCLPVKNALYANKDYYLSGMSNPKWGYQNLTASDIYNFDVGDELHIKYSESDWWQCVWNPGSDGYFFDSLFILKVISKIETDNYYEYKFHRLCFATSYTNSCFSESYDTIKFDDVYSAKFFKSSPIIDKLPLEGEIVDAYCSSYYGLSEFMNLRLDFFIDIISDKGIRTKRKDIHHQDRFWKIEPGMYPDSFCKSEYLPCISPFAEDDYIDYYKGLGGPYYLTSINTTNNWGSLNQVKENKLLYFKKGTLVWGNPINISSLFPEEKLSFSISPNPASDQIKIKWQKPKYSANKIDFIITDLSGRILYSNGGTAKDGQFFINTMNWQPGFYFVRILNDGQLVTYTKLIIIKN